MENKHFITVSRADFFVFSFIMLLGVFFRFWDLRSALDFIAAMLTLKLVNVLEPATEKFLERFFKKDETNRSE